MSAVTPSHQPEKDVLTAVTDEKYTGIFNTTMSATFFWSDVPVDTAPPSDLVIPISARKGAQNAVSQFTVPRDTATNTITTFPRNARRAVFSVSANGQATEEFWWSNVLESDVYTFNETSGAFPGYSPFREVQVLIDGVLAGVQWPFPIIFTGGVSPGLHRPIVSVEAFDLREHEIDITPFLPLLSDGKPHTFLIRIAGINDTIPGQNATLTEKVNENWYVTGKIFVWLDDDANSITTGDALPTVQLAPPTIQLTKALSRSANGTLNETLVYNTAVRRSVLVSARVNTQKTSGTASWSQTLEYSNKGHITAYGFHQVNDLYISGTDEAKGFPAGGSSGRYWANYRYPLFANSSYEVSPQGNLSIWAHVRQGKQVEKLGASVFPDGLEAFGGSRSYLGSVLATQKEGVAGFYQTGDGMNSSGWGTAAQVFHFGAVSKGGVLGDAPDVELYFRNVSAANGSVVYDFTRRAGGAATKTKVVASGMADLGQFAEAEVKVLEGEGVGGAPRVFMGRNEYRGEES